MSKSDKSMKIEEIPSFICAWNGFDLVESHNRQSLINEYDGLFSPEDGTIDYDWCVGNDFDSEGVCFEKLLEVISNDDDYLGVWNTNDNMQIMRIK